MLAKLSRAFKVLTAKSAPQESKGKKGRLRALWKACAVSLAAVATLSLTQDAQAHRRVHRYHKLPQTGWNFYFPPYSYYYGYQGLQRHSDGLILEFWTGPHGPNLYIDPGDGTGLRVLPPPFGRPPGVPYRRHEHRPLW